MTVLAGVFNFGRVIAIGGSAKFDMYLIKNRKQSLLVFGSLVAFTGLNIV